MLVRTPPVKLTAQNGARSEAQIDGNGSLDPLGVLSLFLSAGGRGKIAEWLRCVPVFPPRGLVVVLVFFATKAHAVVVRQFDPIDEGSDPSRVG